RDGKIERADLFYLYRTDDNPKRDLTNRDERIEAIREATGPAGEWGVGQFDHIASEYDRPGADRSYWERVWLNRWKKSNEQAFDPVLWGHLARPGTIQRGSLVVAGFDGARRKDSTAIVITEVATGTQEVWALWERDTDDPDWEVDEAEVQASVEHLMQSMRVWRMNCDPAYWIDTIGKWAGTWGCVEEWWTNGRPRVVAKAVRAYREAVESGAVGWSRDHEKAVDFTRHIAAAGRRDLPGVTDDDGEPLFTLEKIHLERKFDAAMAAVLSWQAYLDALKAGKGRAVKPSRPRRIR
ncbi:MAG TPA: hypothetical protein VFL73_08055, partial [Solirubrobacteraceae bacterium]|nr:hypothetical protein [Solirubrobacteraceae bacterium]